MSMDRFGSGRMARRALLVAALLAAPAGASAQFPITESFMNSTAPGWTLLGSATLTGGGVDPAGAGWLRLTSATNNQAGSAIYNTAFPSTSGITMSFDYADYGGTGADGFSFYLIDGATATPTVGSNGGSLGYAAKYSNASCATGPLTVTIPGVTSGYVGIGFDEYGNFSACESGVAGPGLTAQSVVVRGSGTSSAAGTSRTAFRYLAGATLASVQAGATVDGVTRASPRRAQVSIVNQKITVRLDLGSGFRTVINGYDLATATGQAALPATFKMGISGSTGGSTNVHELRNVRVDLPANITLNQVVAPASVAVGGTVTFTIAIANDATNAAPGSTLTDAFPAGLAGVSWTAATAGGATVGRASGTGNLAETVNLPRNSSVAYTVTATVTAAAAGQTLSNTVTLAPPTGVANVLTNTVAASVAVSAMPTATALAASPAASTWGSPVTLTATVGPVAPFLGTPAGTVAFYDGAASLGTATLDGAGVATLATSAIGVGSRGLTAVFVGSTAWSGSTSAPVAVSIGQGLTGVTLVSSANPGTFGQAVGFTATVAPLLVGSGVPGGTVTFYDGPVALGTGALDPLGVATFTAGALAAGTHPVTAVYGGDSTYAGSSSAEVTEVVTRAAAAVALTTGTNPSVRGQAVTFTATATSAAGTPGGTVTFLDGATGLGAATLDAAGVATLTSSALAAGTHTITAAYSGDAGRGAAISGALAQRVDPASTSTALASSAAPAVYGQPITLTATVAAVAPGGGTPAGLVTFSDGAASLGTGTLNGAGVATLTTGTLAVGAHSVTASYAATADYGASASAAVGQQIDPAATTTAVASSANPSVQGQLVTLTATVAAVAPGGGTPAGTVTFNDGATTLGTATLDGAGLATLTTSALSVGTHAITATSGATAAHGASTSAALSQVVTRAITTTALASSVDPSVVGQAVTLTANVAVVSPGSGTPSGTVTFYDGATSLGAGALDGAGAATLATSALSAGTHAITASYAASSSFATSTSATLSLRVNAASTSTALASSANPSVAGQPVTLTATVTVASPGGGTPTGTVTFSDGAASLGTGTLDGAGVATLTTSGLSVGTHSLTAAYGGTASHSASTSSPVSQQVNSAATATSVAPAAGSPVNGQPWSYTATVTVTSPGSGTPTGTVTFAEGSTTLGTASLSGGVASASFALPAGGHTLTATYGGATAFTGSAGSTAAPVAKASSVAALSASPAAPVAGLPVTLTAQITAASPGAGTPSGTVTFHDGAAAVGSASLDATGRAALTTGALAVGSHALTASYGGDAGFLAATSAAANVAVAKAGTTTGLASSSPTSVLGAPVTFTATVAEAAPAAATPAGSVTFRDGAAVLGSGALDAAGKASFTTSTLAVGDHAVTAAYAGSPTDEPSTSAPVAQRVVTNEADVTLVASASPLVTGQVVTLTAAVAPSSGLTPTGMVVFKEGAAVLGTAALDATGHAQLKDLVLPVGHHALTADYAGDAGFGAGNSPVLALVVDPAATATTLAADGPAALFGEPVALRATVAAVAPGAGTPGGTVTFSEGSTVLGTAALDASGLATLTTATLAVGGHDVTATYGGDPGYAVSSSALVHLAVAKATAAVTVADAPAPSVLGQPVLFTVAVAPVTPSTATPSGTVTLREGTSVLGTASLDAAGRATFTTAALGAGPHTLAADYAGADGFAPATSADLVHQVDRAATSTALAAAPAPAVGGEPIHLTATVGPAAPGAGAPGGTVTFLDGATVLGTAPVGLDGTASLDLSLPVGDHTLGASYGGDAGFLPSAAPAVAVAVAAGQSGTTLAVAPSPAVRGEPVTLTAAVAPVAPSAASPAGAVVFTVDGVEVGRAPVVNGVATLAAPALTGGTHQVVATFLPDGTLDGSSSAPATLLVTAAPMALSLAAAPSASSWGQPVLLTATASSTGGVPRGTVTFRDGGALLGTAELDAGGKAALTLASLAPGEHALAADSAATADWQAASAAASAHVAPASTATAIAVSPAGAAPGQAATLQATVAAVAPGAGTPAGTVTFTAGAIELGSAVLDATGHATVEVASLPAGAGSVTASYGGSAEHLPSSASAGLGSQTLLAASQVTISAAPSPANAGTPVTLTVVASSDVGTPGGTVVLRDGATVLGAVTLDAAGHASLVANGLALGDHTLTATYAGDATHAAASGATSLAVVTPTETQVAVTSSRNPSRRGRPITFVATITGPGGAPSGAVTFKDGATVLGTGTLDGAGHAAFTTRALARGSHPITAEYTPSGPAVVSGALVGGQLVENTPPVALAGTALSLGGPGAHSTAAEAVVDARGGALDAAQGTVELWARAGWSAPAEVGPAPLLAGLGDGTAVRWQLVVAPDRAHLVVTLGATSASLPADLTDGNWHHLALVEDGARAILFLDGVEAGRVAAPFGAATSTSLALGRGFTGELDEVRTWSIARTAAELAAAARRPLAGTETGLTGLWRMDEGSGLELFDASPSHLDGAVALVDPGTATPAAFTASTAWTTRRTTSGVAIEPAALGYDPDGDPLTLTVTSAPAHGAASPEADRVELGYLSAPGYVGTDAVGFTLGDGDLVTAGTLELVVDRVPACHASSDCGEAGAICVSGTCLAGASVDVRAGGCGCTSGGGGALALWSSLALLAIRRRRRAAPVTSEGRAP